MALLLPADFRPNTTHEACRQVTLTPSEADDADLTATIARMTRRIYDLTGDQFETQTETVDLDVSVPTQILRLPKRTTAVTTVKTRDWQGTLTDQTNTPQPRWRLHSSLDVATGSIRIGEVDKLSIIPEGPGLLATYWSPWIWPPGPSTVQVNATVGWTVCPGDIKRCLALLVWDHYKAQRGDLGRMIRLAANGETQEFNTQGLTGILEADAILRDYDHRWQTMVA